MRPPKNPPPRFPIEFDKEDAQVTVVLCEYAAIRAEIVATLTSQVATLSFGAATVGLLVTAAANLWAEALVSSLILIFGVPLVCFLVLSVHSGEFIRLMRAGLFIRRLENEINAAFARKTSRTAPLNDQDEHLMCWEHWDDIRQKNDIDNRSRAAIFVVFYALALGFGATGHIHLPVDDLSGAWIATIRLGSIIMAVASVIWLWRLVERSNSYRELYNKV